LASVHGGADYDINANFCEEDAFIKSNTSYITLLASMEEGMTIPNSQVNHISTDKPADEEECVQKRCFHSFASEFEGEFLFGGRCLHNGVDFCAPSATYTQTS
jgi:hypothetical protein